MLEGLRSLLKVSKNSNGNLSWLLTTTENPKTQCFFRARGRNVEVNASPGVSERCHDAMVGSTRPRTTRVDVALTAISPSMFSSFLSSDHIGAVSHIGGPKRRFPQKSEDLVFGAEAASTGAVFESKAMSTPSLKTLGTHWRCLMKTLRNVIYQK